MIIIVLTTKADYSYMLGGPLEKRMKTIMLDTRRDRSTRTAHSEFDAIQNLTR